MVVRQNWLDDPVDREGARKREYRLPRVAVSHEHLNFFLRVFAYYLVSDVLDEEGLPCVLGSHDHHSELAFWV